MERHPPRQPLADLEAQHVGSRPAEAGEFAVERDRLAQLGHMVDAVDADRVVRDEAVCLGDDRITDAAHVLDAVEARAQLLDSPEPGRALADGVEQPRIRDGSRHLARERGAQLQLVGRPVVRGAVIEDEEADGLIVEHERDEADPPEAEPPVDGRKGRGGVGVVHDDDSSLLDRPVADDRIALAHLRNGADELLVKVPVRDESERVAAVIEEPQARDLRPEQGVRRVEDVLEDLIELEVGADLGDDAAEGGDPGIRTCGRPAGVAARGAIADARWSRPAGLSAVVERERHAAGGGYPSAVSPWPLVVERARLSARTVSAHGPTHDRTVVPAAGGTVGSAGPGRPRGDERTTAPPRPAAVATGRIMRTDARRRRVPRGPLDRGAWLADTRAMRAVDPRVTAWSFRRQLLDGTAPTALSVLEAVAGVYGFMPTGPLSIRARCRGVTPEAFRALEEARLAIRMRAMRTSTFLIARSQAEHMAAATAVPDSRYAWLLRAAGVADGDLSSVRATVLAAAAEPGTPAELRNRLSAAAEDGAAWADGERFRVVLTLLTAFGDLVAVGGASLSSNTMRYVARRAWLGATADAGPAEPPVERGSPPEPAAGEARAWLAGEYLRAFGPARVEDLAWWAGWTRGRADDALAAHDTVDIGDGLRLLAGDLPGFEAAPQLPPVLTLLPKWDAWTMGYPLDGRGRFLELETHDRVFDGDGNGLAMVLRGGRAIGAWAHRGERGLLAVDLDLFERMRSAEREALEAELAAVAAFLGYRGTVVRDVGSVIPKRRRQRKPLEG